MAKIQITENELKQIIRESVESVLNEEHPAGVAGRSIYRLGQRMKRPDETPEEYEERLAQIRERERAAREKEKAAMDAAYKKIDPTQAAKRYGRTAATAVRNGLDYLHAGVAGAMGGMTGKEKYYDAAAQQRQQAVDRRAAANKKNIEDYNWQSTGETKAQETKPAPKKPKVVKPRPKVDAISPEKNVAILGNKLNRLDNGGSVPGLARP